jgi:transcriptional regulator with XRE-family HTH domain
MRTVTTVGDEMSGIRLKNIRLMRGLRIVDVAAAVSVSASLLSRIECGKRQMHAPLLERLAECLQVDAEDLAGPSVPTLPLSNRVEYHWPLAISDSSGDQHLESTQMADLALTAAMRDTLAMTDGASATERFRACKSLAALASRPLEALLTISKDDDDPIVRQAAGQLLGTLNEAYCEFS